MGWTLRHQRRHSLLSILVIIPMVFGTFLFAPALPAHGVDDPATFEVGDEEPDSGSLAALIESSPAPSDDWRDLDPVAGTFDPGEVLVINDTGWLGNGGVIDPATADAVEDFCPNINDDDIIAGGTDIHDYPFVVVEGSVPGKADLCQVYVSYGFADVGGETHTIAFIGALRREITGTAAVAVELNEVSHAQRGLNDVLITFEFDGSGPVSDINVRKWEGSAWGDPVGADADGSSWEHFGEIRVDLSDTNLLPPPETSDDCSSFSTVLPYGFRGNDDSSQVGDWMDPQAIDIPRCGELTIIKDATPASGDLDFDWRIADGDQGFADLTGTIKDGGSVTKELVNGTYNLTEDTPPAPYALDRIECTGGVDPSEIVMEVGTSVTCTIYNVSSAVEVVKAGDGDGAALFDFTVTDQDPFQLSLGGTSDTYLYVPGTTVTVTETVPGGAPEWDLTGIACVGSASGNVSPEVELEAGTATFDTLVGEVITCTYTNSQDALLTLEKEVINLNGGTAADTEWTLEADGPVTISGTEGQAAITNANVPVGSYDLSESGGPDGYTPTDWVCVGGSQEDGDTVTLAAGDIVTCTITNDDDPGSLTLLKTVSPQYGGEALDTEWTLTATGPTPGVSGTEGQAAITDATVDAGDYVLSESGGPFGWEQQGEWSCNAPYDAASDTVTVGLGESVTCEVTNTDIAPQLTLVKDLDNTYGGNATLDDFLLSADGPVSITGVTGDPDVTNADVEVGSYTLSELGPLGYVQVGEWSCIGGTFTGPDQIELGPGGSATCTVSNIDEQPTLTVVKEVNNDHGGTLGPDDFPLYIDANLVTNNVAQSVLSNTTYVVSEDLTGIVGYSQVGAVSCSIDGGADFDLTGGEISLNEGEDAVCTITNEDIPSKLTLLKTVITDDGGDAVDTDWTLNADGPDNITGSEGDTSITSAEILPGDYDLSESGPTGYAQFGDWNCGEATMVDGDTVSIALGEEVTCEVTNDDIAPGLTVVKVVINDDGGTAVPGDFQLYVNGEAAAQGVALDVLPDVEYTVTEDNLFGYTNLGVVCHDSEGPVAHPVTLSEGDAVLCTITNDDIAPRLTLEKVVINDGGGEAVDTDWTLSADGPDSVSGSEGDVSVTDAAVTAGDYVLSESFISGYEQAGDWDCGDATVIGGDTVTLGVGDVVTCTVTNDQLDADLAITKDDLVDPIVLTTDEPVGQIEYEIFVTNLGPGEAKDVVVTDTLPATVTFVSAVAGVGTCSEADGIVTCSLGDMAVGEVIGIAIVVDTQSLGEVTDFSPLNEVEVTSITPETDLSNNVDDEETEIIEVEDIEVLPFTGLYSDFWFIMALLLVGAGALFLFMSRALKESDSAPYPG